VNDLPGETVVETNGEGSLPPACSFMTRFGQSRSRLLAFQQRVEVTRLSVINPEHP
jgi:hypothetical protein